MNKIKNNFLIYLFFFILIFSCSRKNIPFSPEATLTFTPTCTYTKTPVILPTLTSTTGIIHGVLNLPGNSEGKKYYIFLFSSFNGFFNSEIQISGICGTGNNIPYSISIPEGSYYLVAYVDVDNNGTLFSPNAGDYVGVYGTLWPLWPDNANINISNGEELICNVNLVTGFDNVTGSINLYEPAPNKICQIFIDKDTEQLNTNYVVKKEIFIIDNSISINYSMLVLIPGNYYIYAGIDIDNSGLPFYTPDQFGYYGTCSCNPKSPPYYPNANITNINTVNTFNFILGKYF